MSETAQDRGRRKFGAGVVEQIATGLGGYAAGVFTAGVVAPVVAGALGAATVQPLGLAALVGGSLVLSALLLAAAAVFKGRAKRLDDDELKRAETAVETRYVSATEADDD